jgi:hypothetical protein
MQQDAFEVMFCDLCGTSVPAADVDRGAAIHHKGKTVGACCLPPGWAGPSAVAAAATPGAGAPATPAPAAAAGRAPAEGRLLPVALVLLAAIAAATIFVDQRLASADRRARLQYDNVVQAMRSDSDVLQAVALGMDSVAKRPDLDTLAERLTAVDGSAQLAQEQVRQQVESLRQVVAGLQQDVRAVAKNAIDYRPLFDDLRQQMQRHGVALADLRAASVAPVGAPAPEASRPPEPSNATPAVPAPVAEAMRQLDSSDPAVRFEAVDKLLATKDLAVLPGLLPLTRDVDSFVRRLTVEGLREFKHATAVEALLAALLDTDENVRETAWESLKVLTNQKLAFDPLSKNKDVLQRGHQRWLEWWEKNKATFGT